MIQLHLPWLELSILLPLVGALAVLRLRDPDDARRVSLVFSGLCLLTSCGAWQDFALLHTYEAHDRWDVIERVFGEDLLVIDELSAPLLSLGALIYFLTLLATMRTKIRRFSFASTLLSETILLMIFSCRQPWAVVAMLVVGTIPQYFELRRRLKPTRVYVVHMVAFAGLLLGGQTLVTISSQGSYWNTAGIIALTLAVLLRNGVVPVHCWITDLFEHASFGGALLRVTPMVGAYGAMRLVFPIAPDWVLHSISILSLATAIYAAGMALVQIEARRFFTYVFLSHSSLVLVGLELATPIGLTGALCVWLSVGLSLTGFGLTLRSIEARTGRLSLAEFHGLYAQAPVLATFFLLTGLASIGFPGTVGFVGTEMLVEGAVMAAPWIGAIVVATAALNGLAMLHAYFRVFTGATHPATIDLNGRAPERFAILMLTLLILGGGLWPQPGVVSRYHAAAELVAARQRHNGTSAPQHVAQNADAEPKGQATGAESVVHQLPNDLGQHGDEQVIALGRGLADLLMHETLARPDDKPAE
ncbi:MAG: oxidoreductase [Pirellulales bacterium]|nr:oxidoreductase [Pirellulales bacterium]